MNFWVFARASQKRFAGESGQEVEIITLITVGVHHPTLEAQIEQKVGEQVDLLALPELVFPFLPLLNT